MTAARVVKLTLIRSEAREDYPEGEKRGKGMVEREARCGRVRGSNSLQAPARNNDEWSGNHNSKASTLLVAWWPGRQGSGYRDTVYGAGLILIRVR